MWLLIAFILVPMIEIALFIQVGGVIGIWWTLLIVLVTAVAGSFLVRQQGLRELTRLRENFRELNDPTESLASGAMILFSGALLLTPGFFTDALGLSLLIPGVRRWVYLKLRERVTVQRFEMGEAPQRPQPGPRDRVIDADFEDVTPRQNRGDGPSRWTEH